MKKILLFICSAAISTVSMAQTIPGADMETWRTSTTGLDSPITIQAPYGWYGVDSVIIALGQNFGTLLNATDADFHRNLFKDSTVFHSGSYSAKIMTTMQDTLLLPGVLSTAQTHISVTIFPTPGITGITFSDGTPVSVKPMTVSAWVKYYPGPGGADSGMLNVQALSHLGGKDSVIGMGTIIIAPTSSWVQVTDTFFYPAADSTFAIDTMRITFTSSQPNSGLDSSTLYVDDVTMTSIANPDYTGLSNISAVNLVKVYPNPANNTLYFSGILASGMKATLYSISGQTMAEKALTGNDAIDVSLLPAGAYFYTITDARGNAVQSGKVSVTR